MHAPSNSSSQVVLFHGYAETPDRIWFPWLARELAPRGVATSYEKLPDPLHPDYRDWLLAGQAMTAGWNDRTVVVGHSLGGLLALRLLALPETPAVRAVITVGTPFCSVLPKPWLYEFHAAPMNGDLLRAKARRRVVVHSLDDAIVLPDHAARYAELLGADLRLVGDQGHFIDVVAPAVLQAVLDCL